MLCGVRYLALGDSYTIGEGVEPPARWPAVLARLLREREIEVDEPQIVARTGWTTDELMAAIDQERPRGPFGLVSLLIGVNNQYRGRLLDEYRRQFRDLLGMAVDLAEGEPCHVVVVSIPDWGATPFAEGRDRIRIAAEIDAFNRVNREEAANVGARYADVTAYSREVGAQKEYLVADRLHYARKAYAAFAEIVLAALDGK
jgi:lysophospholipase L1-like esterase